MKNASAIIFVCAALGCATTLAALGKVPAEAVIGLTTTFGAWLVPSPVKSAAAGPK